MIALDDKKQVMNIVIAGLGGQGVLKASDILGDAAFRADFDVKKSELHGMSQRGGSVSSDVRYGRRVFSPMVPDGEADVLLVLTADQEGPNLHRLKPGGLLILPNAVDESKLSNRRSLNTALLGVLSRHLEISESAWHKALESNLPEKFVAVNLEAFALGRESAKS